MNNSRGYTSTRVSTVSPGAGQQFYERGMETDVDSSMRCRDHDHRRHISEVPDLGAACLSNHTRKQAKGSISLIG